MGLRGLLISTWYNFDTVKDYPSLNYQMAGGGILQLAAASAINNIYMIGDPQITLFKRVYKRHIQFSIYDDVTIPSNRGDFNASSIIRIEKKGDLLGKLHLIIDLPEIILGKFDPTFKYLKQILSSYGIEWTYTQNDDDIVTFDDYNYGGIMDAINDSITLFINTYNFYSNACVLANNPQIIIDQINDPLLRLNDTSDSSHSTTIENLKHILADGESVGIEIFCKMLTTYANEYSGEITSYLPKDDIYIVETINSTRDLTLYTTLFRESIFKYGFALNFLLKYSADTMIYNTFDDSATNSLDSHNSLPLFASFLSRGTEEKSKLIPYILYTADDMRFITYITFLNRLTRIKVLAAGDTDSFNPYYSVINNGTEISLLGDDPSIFTPDERTFDESLLFYSVMDPDIVNFPVYGYDIGTSVDVYFNNKISPTYLILEKYNHLIPVDRSIYSTTDSYKIYSKLMNDLKNDPLNNKIKSASQANFIAKTIKYSISNNISYNFDTLSNVLTVLFKAMKKRLDHYIVSFYKTYSFSDNIYKPNNSSFVSTTDNFKNIIKNIITLPTPSGITVKKYFDDHVESEIKNFLTVCSNQLRSINYSGYIDNYQLWERVTNSDLFYKYYNMTSGKPIPDASVFEKIALMNYIPLLVASDIPKMVYYIFQTYGQFILDEINTTLSLSAFLEQIDFRDSDDDLGVTTSVINASTKVEIYNKILEKVAVADIVDVGLQIMDAEYYEKMKNLHTSSTKKILTCSLRPESFLPKYSTQDTTSGALIDFSYNEEDLVYLPIEWLTQTYYQIIKTKINAYVDSLSVSSEKKILAKNNLNGMLGNIINCFVGHNKMPKYEDYYNNDYMLLGLMDETNTTFSKYKRNLFTTTVTTPKYSDAISTIWYQTQKKIIQQYNSLFNDTLLSNKYYTDNLGSEIAVVFNFIKERIIDIDPDLNSYYSASNQYIDRVPDSIIESISDVQEIFRPIDTEKSEGFDFYRLKNIGDFEEIDTAAYEIMIFVKNLVKTWDYMLDFYNKNKYILPFIGDSDALNYTQSSEIKIRRKNSYLYEKSENINNYFSEHIKLKYVTNNNILSANTKTFLNTLIDNTNNYWANHIYGILDSIYNPHLPGNIVDEFLKLDNIPSGLDEDDLLDSTFNPYDTFFLHDWYLDAILSQNFTYGDMLLIDEVMNSVLYEDDFTTEKITSEIISQSKSRSKLFSFSSQNSDGFHDFTFSAWLVMELIINLVQKNTGINFSEMIYVIDADAPDVSSTVTNLNKIFLKNVDMQLNKINKISYFKSTVSTTDINNLKVFYDIYKDIVSYKQLNGNYVIKTQLEKRIVDVINNTPPKFAWVKKLGYKLLKKISFTVNSQPIETHTPELLNFIHNINKLTDHERGHNILIGNTKEMYTLSSKQRSLKQLMIPLEFFFCKNEGNILPLSNLLFSDLNIEIDFSSLDEVLYIDADSYLKKTPRLKCSLLAQYVYLEEEERTRMISSKLEYLIERFNYNGKTVHSANTIINNDMNVKIDIKIGDPIKYLIWYVKFQDSTTELPIDKIDWDSFGYNVRNKNGTMVRFEKIAKKIIFKMNGVQREQDREENYYTHVVPNSRGLSSFNKGEYIICFALYPLLLQPSGTANYSEIFDSSITMVFTDEIKQLFMQNENLQLVSELWGCSNNIYRVVSGMSGLAFFKSHN